MYFRTYGMMSTLRGARIRHDFKTLILFEIL